ncbi:MAG: hypothetical protein IKE30_07700, partial [Clostridia bacterium]|nr:hypothetical protein [Clostridia bacterium]
MKRWLSITLIALTALLPCLAQAENSEFFETIVLKSSGIDINYYDMLGSKASSFDSGPETFYKDYLSMETTQGSTTYPSLISRWTQVAEGIVDAGDTTTGTTVWDNIKENRRVGYPTVTGMGSAHSIKDAVNAAANAINSASPSSGYIIDKVMLPDLPKDLAEKTRTCVYYYKGIEDEEADARAIPFCEGSYAVVFYDFQVAQVVNDSYITKNIMATEDYKLDLNEPDVTAAQTFINETAQAAQASAQLTTTVSETVTLSSTDSYQYSQTQSWNIGGKITLGKKDWPIGGEISGGYSKTWGSVTGKSYTNGESSTSSSTNASSISPALPPYTQTTVIQSQGDGSMNIDIKMPFALSYKVMIIYLFNFQRSGKSYAATVYEADTNRNSTDARHDLYQRVKNRAAEPDGINNDDDTLQTLAMSIYTNVPLSKGGTVLDYSIRYLTSRLSEIRPLKNLARVELNDKRTSMTMNTGDALDVSTVQVVGLNVSDAPYYGFDDAQGSWILEDTSGNPIEGNKNDYIKLEKDPVTCKLTLTALQPGGTVVLKFLVPENTYIDVDKTPVGATGDKTVYIDPKNVDNQATLVVKTTANAEGYRIVAEGQVSGHVGDPDIKLDGEISPVAAYALDPDGMPVTVPIKWRAELPNGTISIDENNSLKFLAAGENRICAQWGDNASVHSEWLPVRVAEPQRLTALEISDPGNLLATWRLGSVSSRTYNLSSLKLQCLDQSGEAMPAPDDLVWYVSKDTGDAEKIDDPTAFRVAEPGTYSLKVRTADGSVESNGLSLTVEEAPKPVSITLSDDEYDPLLADYILHDGGDTFDLRKLTAAAVDQYGDDYPVDMNALNWSANGAALNGPTLTVDQAGRYVIRCSLPEMTKNSNDLVLTVKPARAPAEMTLADDRYNPVLADYILNDGDDTFDLTKLKTSCVDQYGGEYPLKAEEIVWLVNGADNGSGTLTVNAAGTYGIAFTLNGTKVRSNELALTVKPARAPAEMALADDPYSPILTEYILHDGNDTFDLTKLAASCTDQYGDEYPLKAEEIVWLVNGTDNGSGTLTADAAGT